MEGVDQDGLVDLEDLAFALLPPLAPECLRSFAGGGFWLGERLAQQGRHRRIGPQHQHRLGEGFVQPRRAGEELQLSGLDLVRGRHLDPSLAEEDELDRIQAIGHRGDERSRELEGRRTHVETHAGQRHGLGGIGPRGGDGAHHSGGIGRRRRWCLRQGGSRHGERREEKRAPRQ